MVPPCTKFSEPAQSSGRKCIHPKCSDDEWLPPNDFESHDDEEDEESNCILTNAQKYNFYIGVLNMWTTCETSYTNRKFKSFIIDKFH